MLRGVYAVEGNSRRGGARTRKSAGGEPALESETVGRTHSSRRPPAMSIRMCSKLPSEATNAAT